MNISFYPSLQLCGGLAEMLSSQEEMKGIQFIIKDWICLPNTENIGISYKRKCHQHFLFIFPTAFPSFQTKLFVYYSICFHLDI